MLNATIRFFLENKLVAWILLLFFAGWGIVTVPFDFNVNWLPRDPVAVDAIPDIGENQQIVFSRWMGRSPQDVEDQISYPLTSALLGVPGVKTIRSNSMFGFSPIYIIFQDDIDFYWSRSRILEKLNSLPVNLLPDGVQPSLGPDTTALGQIYWYTLEGRDAEGNPTGGWDPHELRTIQDYYVRYGLSSAEGAFGSAAETVVFVLIDGQLAGYIALSDEIRPESADAIQTFRDNNIKVYMATGDNEVVGKAVSEELGLDGYYAEVLPPLWR